jgi:hypothetical protein
MEMRRQQNVDLLQAGLLRRGEDPFRVPVVRRPVTRSHQHRFAAGRYDQRGRTAIRVDPIDFQVSRRGTKAAGPEQAKQSRGCDSSHRFYQYMQRRRKITGSVEVDKRYRRRILYRSSVDRQFEAITNLGGEFEKPTGFAQPKRRSSEASPIVVNGVMYLPTPRNWIVALCSLRRERDLELQNPQRR